MADTAVVLIGLRDYKDATANVKLHVPSDTDPAALETWIMANFLSNLDGIIGPVIESCELVTVTDFDVSGINPAPKALAVDDVDVERGANLALDADNTSYNHTVRIPGILPTLDDGNVVDLTGSVDMSAVVTVLEDAVFDTDKTFTDKYGNDLLEVLTAKISFHKKK
jgi:hypothetical protein